VEFDCVWRSGRGVFAGVIDEVKEDAFEGCAVDADGSLRVACARFDEVHACGLAAVFETWSERVEDGGDRGGVGLRMLISMMFAFAQACVLEDAFDDAG